ncbi:MAG: sigma-70 family RNA polymerase sigma factor [Planctomycetes bacterium]|nr:sigma-70 family RNA polymerase sigma factor [Planctomycetota bacterium]
MITLHLSDGALVARALAGDADAFEALVLRHQRKAHAVAQANGVPEALAGDVVQEAFLEALRDLACLRDQERFAGWLVSITRNAARRHHRREAARQHRETRLEGGARSGISSPEDRLEARELREQVRRKVDELPEGVREAIFLYYSEGRSTREVAKALDTTRAAVKKRLQKGRDLLSEDLWRELGSALRDILPGARAWKAKGRKLALVLLAAVPASGTHAACGAGGTTGAGAVAGTGAGAGAGKAAIGAGVLLGGAIMSGKKITVTALAAAAVLGLAGWVATRPRAPVRPEAAVALLEPARRDPVAQLEGRDGGAAEPVARVANREAAAPPVALRVRVLDEAGEAVSGARVLAMWAQADADGGGKIVEGPAGRSLEEVAPGELIAREARGDTVSLTAAAPGFLPRRERREVPPDGLKEPVEIRLEPAETLRFRLFDPRRGDAPVAGARAGPIARPGWLGEAEQPRTGFPPENLDARGHVDLLFEVLSDEDGELSLPYLPGTFWVTREGYGPTAIRFYADRKPDAGSTSPVPMYPLAVKREVKVAYGEENLVEVVLEAVPAALYGRVLDPDGRPVASAEVAVFAPPGNAYVIDDEIRQGAERKVTTGSDGAYELTFSSRPQPFYLLVRHPEHPFHVSEALRLEANERRRHDVQLPRAATITARLAERLADRAGVEVELSNEGTPAHPLLTYSRKLQSDAGGAARFEKVHAGAWTILWLEDRTVRRLSAAVQAGRSYELLLGEKDEGDLVELTGLLVAGGRPVAEKELWLFGEDDHVIGIEKTGPSGEFRFQEVPPGRRALALWPSDKRSERPLRYLWVEVRSGMAPLYLDITTTTLTGRVTSASGPIAAASVKPYTLQPIQGEDVLASFHSARTEADGSFRLPGLYQVPALLVFEKEGHLTRRVEWRPTGTPESQLAEVRLEPHEGRGRVRFRVVEAETGAEVPRILLDLRAVDASGEMPIARLHRDDVEEELAVEALPAGRYRAFVRPGDLVPQVYTSEAVAFEHVAGVDQEVEVRTRRGGSVTLEIETEDGRAPRGAVVEVFDADGNPLLADWRGGTRLRFSSCAPLLGLPLGSLKARVTAPGWKALELPLEVEPGRMARVVKRMERE